MEKLKCPECGSYNVMKFNGFIRMLIVLMAGGMCMIIGLIIWPLLIGAVLALIAAPVVLFGGSSYRCQSCGYDWEDQKKKRLTRKEKRAVRKANKSTV